MKMADLFKPLARPRPYRGAMLGSLSTHYSTGLPTLDAADDFDRARRAQLRSRGLRWLRRHRRERSHPATLPEGAARPPRPAQLEVIALDRIAGTVDPSPHFDARFRPASGLLRKRWERVAIAHRRGTPLPPILVIEGPDGYYVVDGRHRVSVARAVGQSHIDAWVT
jgi:hypothetical protein